MQSLHGFEQIRSQAVPELNTHAVLYRHTRTGAQLLSMENDDENKVFGITFRTPPKDSTGIAHIMEHSVLCGSRKYPVKKPFVELLKGSLKTFLNAITFPDKTCYPVASLNLQDFYNLVDVYLDAVLHPLIPPTTLQQEGWHYELDSTDAPLRMKGVVFNEMKGAYASPENYLARQIQSTLFPENAYGFDSGGDPLQIPDLDYAQFKEFHETYYHPSNAYIFFYGDDPPEKRLRILAQVLGGFDRREPESAIPLHRHLSRPRHVALPYAAGMNGGREARSYVTVAWLLPENADSETVLAFNLLNYFLVGSPASPLRKALLESGLGEDLAGGGLDTGLRQLSFAIGLKGVSAQDIDRVEPLIMDTLRSQATGVEAEMVAATINTVEFRLRENNTGAYPRGLVLMVRALTTWLHGGDPIAPLAFEAPLATLKARLEAGEPLFEDLISRHLLENPHRVTLHLYPDADLLAQREAEEQRRLDLTRKGWSQDQVQAAIDGTQQLIALQTSSDPPEALAQIPSLRLEDLDREMRPIPLEATVVANTRHLYHDLFTNGIVYIDLGFDLAALPQQYLPYVPLFGRSLVEMGTQNFDPTRLSQRISQTTGGIRPRVFTSTSRFTGRDAAWLFLRGKATVDRAGDLLAILREVLLSVRLDDQARFRQFLLEEKAAQEAGVVPGGHWVVNRRLRSHENLADWADEQMNGLSYLFALRDLAEKVTRDWPSVLADLEKIRGLLVNRGALLVNVTLDGASRAFFEQLLAQFLAELPDGPFRPAPWTLPEGFPAEGWIVPAQVNYVGQSANLYRHGYTPDGSVMAVTKYLRTAWFWDRVRVQGGAYGAHCPFDLQSGVLTFLSYRDPNLLDTLATYDQTGEFLHRVPVSPDDLRKSIIGAISDLDTYRLPDAKGYLSMTRYLVGETDADLQAFRDQLLDTSQVDFREFGEFLAGVQGHRRVAVLGSRQAIDAANAERGGFLEARPIM